NEPEQNYEEGTVGRDHTEQMKTKNKGSDERSPRARNPRKEQLVSKTTAMKPEPLPRITTKDLIKRPKLAHPSREPYAVELTRSINTVIKIPVDWVEALDSGENHKGDKRNRDRLLWKSPREGRYLQLLLCFMHIRRSVKYTSLQYLYIDEHFGKNSC
ncbi:MAG TPA: hypothetical protein VNL13_00405, partial [Sulfolobales archaeon]|nr:hypothetical protein [Sulfolobales archaeon]